MAKKITIDLDPELKLGQKSPNVKNLQAYLEGFGYLHTVADKKKAKKKKPPTTAIFAGFNDTFLDDNQIHEPGVFDKNTREALLSFQAARGMPLTGVLDMGTHAEINRHRCGFPDFPGGGNRVNNFVVAGTKWPKTDLTYKISKFSGSGLSQADVEMAMEAAFGLWSDVTPLTFERVATNNADIDIRFEVRSHGSDCRPFDGAFNVLAHAFFPTDGRAHFDDEEPWRVDFPPTDGNTIDLISVAAHEFGHLLGLDHSFDRAALMFSDYLGPHRFLAQDDINGIRNLYGT